MNPFGTMFAVGLLLFGAGFVVGHYGLILPPASVPRELPKAAAPLPPHERSGTFSRSSPLSQTLPLSPHGTPTAQDGASPQGGLPPHERLLTPEVQAQLRAQQQEAQQAQIGQLDAMIQSMEQSGLPKEQIQHFRDMKKTLEEVQISEPQPEDVNPPERTEEELKSDMATSLEQAGVPAEKRNQMLETLSTETESMPGAPPIPPSPTTPSGNPGM